MDFLQATTDKIQLGTYKHGGYKWINIYCLQPGQENLWMRLAE